MFLVPPSCRCLALRPCRFFQPSPQTVPFAKTGNSRCFPASRSAEESESKILVCYPATGSRQNPFVFQTACRSADRNWNRRRRSHYILDKAYEQFNSLAGSSPDEFRLNRSENAHCGGIFGLFLGGFPELFFSKSIAVLRIPKEVMK